MGDSSHTHTDTHTDTYRHTHTHTHACEINDNLQGCVVVRSRAGHEIPARCSTHPYQLLSHHGVGMFRLEGGQQPFCIPALQTSSKLNELNQQSRGPGRRAGSDALGDSKLVGTRRAGQGCALHEEVMGILSPGTAPCSREAQIQHSCKFRIGAYQGATASLAAAGILLCFPRHWLHQAASPSPPAGHHCSSACHTTPGPLPGGAEGRGTLAASAPHCAAPQLLLPATALLERAVWAQQGALWEGGCRQQRGEPFCMDHSCSSAPSLGRSPFFAADSPGTCAHLMDHLRAGTMGESLLSSSSAWGLLPAMAVP